MEVRISHLLPEFLADTLILLGALHTAGAIAAGPFQTLFDGLHHLLILIESNGHKFSFLYASLPKSCGGISIYLADRSTALRRIV